MTFYARMLDHDYTSKPVFNSNFMTDWRKAMNQAERDLIKDIRKCDFTQIAEYFKELTEQCKTDNVLILENDWQLIESLERCRNLGKLFDIHLSFFHALIIHKAMQVINHHIPRHCKMQITIKLSADISRNHSSHQQL